MASVNTNASNASASNANASNANASNASASNASANYHEYVYLPQPPAHNANNADNKDSGGMQAININLSEAQFKALMQGCKRANLKPFSRGHKCYIKGNLLLEADDDGEVRVWERTALALNVVPCSGILHLQYKRSKLPMHAFPCTTAMHHVYHSRSVVFRLHNRVFLNFEVQHDPHTSTNVFKVYVNYNHDEAMDKKTIQERLAFAFRLLNVTPTEW